MAPRQLDLVPRNSEGGGRPSRLERIVDLSSRGFYYLVGGSLLQVPFNLYCVMTADDDPTVPWVHCVDRILDAIDRLPAAATVPCYLATTIGLGVAAERVLKYWMNGRTHEPARSNEEH